MNRLTTVIPMAVLLFGVTTANAQTTTNIVITPTSPVFDSNNVTGIPFDAAPGHPSGSFASNGLAKTDMYFSPSVLFLREVALGEIASISYWTKIADDHVSSPADWYLTIYTKPYVGDVSSATWYGDRIGTEPYFSSNLNDPAGQWNQWSTDGTENQLRFFESTAGAPGATFGSYTDPDWDLFVSGAALSGDLYAGHEILFLSVQTGSAWAAGFTGQVDGLRIELTDGSVATVNFESPTPPASKGDCKKGGWMNVTRLDGSLFVNQGDCIQYVSTDK